MPFYSPFSEAPLDWFALNFKARHFRRQEDMMLSNARAVDRSPALLSHTDGLPLTAAFLDL